MDGIKLQKYALCISLTAYSKGYTSDNSCQHQKKALKQTIILKKSFKL